MIGEALRLHRLFQRGFLADSPDFIQEKQPDGRYLLKLKTERPRASTAVAIPTGQVTVEGSILNEATLDRVDFELTTWNKILDSLPLTAPGQFNVNLDPAWFPLFEAWNADGVSPNSFNVVHNSTDFIQLFGNSVDLADWHCEIAAAVPTPTAAEFTADLSTGVFNFSLSAGGFLYVVNITYRAGG